MRLSFDVPLELTIAGESLELDVTVTGEFHAAQRAYTYPGEFAPTDPPEPAFFEIGSVTVSIDGVARDVGWLLSDEQMSALAEFGVVEAAEQRAMKGVA